MTSSLPVVSTMSHAQPEPKRDRPAALTFPVTLAVEPNEESIADFRSPLGSLAPPGVISSQKKEWFQWPPRLLRTGARTASGTMERSARIATGVLAARSGYFSTSPFKAAT